MEKLNEKEVEIFNYLNDLRDSGVTNMYGARSYIVDEFNIPKKEAGDYLSLWMKNFNEEGYSTNIDKK